MNSLYVLKSKTQVEKIENKNNLTSSDAGISSEPYFETMPPGAPGPIVFRQPVPKPPVTEVVEQITQDPYGTPAPVVAPVKPKNTAFLVFCVLCFIAILAVVGFVVFMKIRKPVDVPATLPDVVLSEEQIAWRQKYFGKADCDESVCAFVLDSDKDGLTGAEEFELQTDPTNPDSDLDGLADGDEVKVFILNPLLERSFNNPKYTDKEDVAAGFDPALPGTRYNAERLATISNLIRTFGLHEPTLTSIGNGLLRYGVQVKPSGNSTTTASTTPLNSTSSSQDLITPNQVTPPLNATSGSVLGSHQSAEKLDRDTTRQDTIKRIAAGLIKFKDSKGYYPRTNSFTEMFELVKPFLSVAVYSKDPINTPPYVYAYAQNGNGFEFTLSFYSETQNILIRYTAENAIQDVNLNASINADDQRVRDLESIRAGLLVYSAERVEEGQVYVFPSQLKLKTSLVPEYLSSFPKDPKTGREYSYIPSANLDNFSLEVKLDLPDPGTVGYKCVPEACGAY